MDRTIDGNGETAQQGHLESRTRVLVSPEDCASRWGNAGLDVLSTPAILGSMESACVRLLESSLRTGEMTVGTEVRMRHLRPVRVGSYVEIVVRLMETGRKISLSFEVTDEAGRLVSDGWHGRAVVDVETFRRRLADIATDHRGDE